MEKLIKLSDAVRAVCKGCLKENPHCRHHWNCPMLTNLSKLPSADRPRGEWIPCSERLPDEDTEVLVVDYNEAMQVCSVTSYKGMPVWEDVYGYWHGIEVFDAWMPLPEPWKGADDESKNHR